jgi:dienelactone hydrolase
VEEPKSTEAYNTEVTFQSGDLTLSAYLCRPSGEGPFPAVIYNHGGKEGKIGGAPEETCQALAAAGFLGFSPIRRTALDFQENVGDVHAGLAYLRTHEDADPKRLGMIGFSRGSALSFMDVTQQDRDIQAVVLLASAPVEEKAFSSLVSRLTMPVFVAVAENDTPGPLNSYQSLNELVPQMAVDMEKAGVDVQLTVYPPFTEHGHLMFFEIGDYWVDILAFLRANL